jgi:multidrug efflux pump subunit AcrA (membrane-fusion protein)
VLAGLAVFAGYKLLGNTTITQASTPVVPTARVTRGSITLTVFMEGELCATKQMNLTAPSIGGALRILSIADTGTAVEKDDVVMELDPADQQYALEQAESELQEAEQELIKRRADIRAQESQDQVTLLTAQFDVRRAELDAAIDADLIAANDHKIRQAELAEAKRNLERVQQDVKARIATNKASVTVLEERKKKAEMSASRARQNMDNLVLKAPMDGIIAVRDNQDASGGYFYEGMSLPAYRAGDTVFSGRPIIDIFDLAGMEVRARVNEQERANIKPGLKARIESNTAPGVTPTATVQTIAGLGRADSRSGPMRQFDVLLELKDPDPRLKPGTTVRVLVEGDVINNALVLPRQALFEVAGKPTVYVRGDGPDKFSPKTVKVVHRTEKQVTVEGLGEGEEVALVDPVAALKLASPGAAGKGPLDVKK